MSHSTSRFVSQICSLLVVYVFMGPAREAIADAGACCRLDGTCVDVEHDACVAEPGEPYPPGETCATTACVPQAVLQPPLFGDPPTLGCLNSWGDVSAYAGFTIVADDFVLPETGAISELHWWGTYRDRLDTVPPDDAPKEFHIAIWSHVNAFEGAPITSFGRPGTVLRSWSVERAATTETYISCSLDETLQIPVGASFRYAWSIPEPERFVAPAGTRFWLTIAAVFGSVSCDCDADVAAPFGTYNAADVDVVSTHVGCTVNAGDALCDASDVNCDGIVDAADVSTATCQRFSGWADPACCYIASEYAWGWATRPFTSNQGAVRVESPTVPFVGMSFGDGNAVTDKSSSPWDASFVVVTSPSDIVVPASPSVDPAGVGRNRYLGFQVPASWVGSDIAVRVRLVSLDRFGSFNGQFRWAGPVAVFVDDPALGVTFEAAALQCQPTFAAWTANEVVYLYGAEAVPSSTYELQAVDVSCQSDLGNDTCYSQPLVIQTNKWGDVVAPYGGGTQPNFADILALVVKFQGFVSAVSKTRAQLQPNIPNPNVNVNFQDISAAVGAFQALPYPYTGPVACP